MYYLAPASSFTKVNPKKSAKLNPDFEGNL